MKEYDQFDDPRSFLSSVLKHVRYELKPSIELFEDENHVYITLDAGYLKEEEIKLAVNSSTAIIHIESRGLRFHKELTLPSKVKPNSVVRTFRNGILDVSVEKSSLKALNE